MWQNSIFCNCSLFLGSSAFFFLHVFIFSDFPLSSFVAWIPQSIFVEFLNKPLYTVQVRFDQYYTFESSKNTLNAICLNLCTEGKSLLSSFLLTPPDTCNCLCAAKLFLFICQSLLPSVHLVKSFLPSLFLSFHPSIEQRLNNGKERVRESKRGNCTGTGSWSEGNRRAQTDRDR